MKSETNSSTVSLPPNGAGIRPAAFAGAPPQSGRSLSNERVESQSLGVSKEGDGSLKAAPSIKREIKRPGTRISYSLKSIDPQKRYTQTGLARALGCSDETIRRMQLRTITGLHGEKKYLGQHVIEALRGTEK